MSRTASPPLLSKPIACVSFSRILFRELLADGDDLTGNLMSSLTSGLSNVLAAGVPFNAGPLGMINGTLDNFDIDFHYFMSNFTSIYGAFKTDLLGMSPDRRVLFEARPISLSKYPTFLQIGSRKPSVLHSLKLNEILWDKLHATFPYSTFNGVKIPNLPSGSTFAATFPRGIFPSKHNFCTACCLIQITGHHLTYCVISPVELFLPQIAVAFGYASSFYDFKAQDFSLNQLFEPDFGPDLSTKLLDSLQGKAELNGAFDRFSDATLSGMPMDPETSEVFDVNQYLPEIQFALSLSASAAFAAPSFKASDLYDSLFPSGVPTIKSFEGWVKKNILSSISTSLHGLYDAKVDVPVAGLSIPNDGIPTFGPNGIDIGVYSERNNKLFPPVIDIDSVQVSSAIFRVTVNLSCHIGLISLLRSTGIHV